MVFFWSGAQISLTEASSDPPKELHDANIIGGMSFRDLCALQEMTICQESVEPLSHHCSWDLRQGADKERLGRKEGGREGGGVWEGGKEGGVWE